MAHYKIANWDTYQHYKQRNPPPPWIKLYTSLLSSEAWVSLDDSGRALMVACMLIGSARGGEIPDNPAYIKRVAYLDKMPDFEPLVTFGFLEKVESLASCYHHASTMLASCYTREEKRREEGEQIESREEGEREADTAPIGADERVFLLSEKCAAERMLAETPEQFVIDRLSLQSKVQDCEEKLRALDCGAVDLFDSTSTPTQDIKPVKDAALAEYLEALPLAWNDMAAQHGLTKVFVDKHGRAVLEGSRLKAAVKAWKSSAVYRENWRIAIQGVSKSPFHLGQNDRKWRADLDFFLRIPKDGPPKFMQFLELARTAEDNENLTPF